jgi:hypothetical protein
LLLPDRSSACLAQCDVVGGVSLAFFKFHRNARYGSPNKGRNLTYVVEPVERVLDGPDGDLLRRQQRLRRDASEGDRRQRGDDSREPVAVSVPRAGAVSQLLLNHPR